MNLLNMSHSKENDIPALSHSGSSLERHCSVVDSTCDTCQNRPGLIPSRAEFVTTALPESSLQGTSIDLKNCTYPSPKQNG